MMRKTTQARGMEKKGTHTFSIPAFSTSK
jgi:hypothetical protein